MIAPYPAVLNGVMVATSLKEVNHHEKDRGIILFSQDNAILSDSSVAY